MNIEDIKKEYEEKFDKFPFFVEKHDYMHPWYGEIKHSALGEIWNFFVPYITSKTPISEEIEDTSPQVDIATEDVKKDEEKLTYGNASYYWGGKLVKAKGKWVTTKSEQETELDAEDREYLQGWLQEKLGHYGLTPRQREKFALKIMNIFRPYLRNYTGTTQVDKANIERNAIKSFAEWFNNNGDRVSDGSVIKSPDVEEYLKEKGTK